MVWKACTLKSSNRRMPTSAGSTDHRPDWTTATLHRGTECGGCRQCRAVDGVTESKLSSN